jgi:hypothetical protein
MIGVPDDIGARFIHAQYHQINLSPGKSPILQKLTNTMPNEPKIGWMTGELDLFLHLRPMVRMVKSS